MRDGVKCMISTLEIDKSLPLRVHTYPCWSSVSDTKVSPSLTERAEIARRTFGAGADPWPRLDLFDTFVSLTSALVT